MIKVFISLKPLLMAASHRLNVRFPLVEELENDDKGYHGNNDY